MKDSRIGESLWLEWIGDGYEAIDGDSIVFYTEDHVDLENEIVRRALASALQRDGIAVSLGDGYKAVEGSTSISHGYAGSVDGEMDLTVCNEYGETQSGDEVDEVVKITLVEIEC
jgi:hypothetical protein